MILYNRQIMVSVSDSSSKRSDINYILIFHLPGRTQSDCVFSHQEKSQCIYECCDVRKFYC